MDVRRLDEMQAQGRSIFDTELAVAYYARVSTHKDEQINSIDPKNSLEWCGNQMVRREGERMTVDDDWRLSGEIFRMIYGGEENND